MLSSVPAARRCTVGGFIGGLSWLLIALVCQPLHAGAPGADTNSHTLTVEVRNPAGDAPVPGVSINLRVAGETNLQAVTDAKGIAHIPYALPQSTSNRYFSLRARRDGFVPLALRWNYEPSSPTPPDRVLFQMEKGTTISGRVLDQNGQPIADAVVVAGVKKSYPRSRQRIALNQDSARTDTQGRWSFSGVPEKPDSIELASYHMLCLTDRAAYYLEPFEPLSALRDGSAVLRLERGTLVEVTVLSPDGHPVPSAEVCYGEERGYGNSIPPIKTNHEGKFSLGIKPGTNAALIAVAPGFAPLIERTKVSEQPLRLTLKLDRPHSVRGRVVDPSGKPIADARVHFYWSGPDRAPSSPFGSAVTEQLKTDRDGRFEWKVAPASAVHASASARGFTSQENLALASDVDHTITLIPPTVVKGRVIDGRTGQPVPQLSLRLAAAWVEGNPFIWQGGKDLEAAARKTPGSFEYTTTQAAHRYLLQAQADGYLPEDSEPIPTDGKAHEITFRLIPARPIEGTIHSPDGTTAHDGYVYVVPAHRDGWIQYLDLNNDDVEEHERSSVVHAKIGADGRFSIPAQKDNFALLVLTATGSVLVPGTALHGDIELRLKPWAHVVGTVILDGKPAANIALQTYDPEETPVEGQPRMVRRSYIKTDAVGRFDMGRVMPGRLTLAQWVPNGIDRRIWAVIRASLDVQGGQSYDLKIGSSGRIVTGRLLLPHAEVWMIRKAEVTPRNAGANQAPTSGLDLLKEGQFRVLDLKPGDYTLHVAVHEPPPGDSCGWGRLISEYVHAFSVPPGSRVGNAPLDLGTLEPTAVGGRPLQAGDQAPDFTIKTLDGKNLALADLRGKYVLLDFWASWCAPCVAEMPNLRSIAEQFASDKRLVVISVSIDERLSEAARFVKLLKLSWCQGLIGPESPVVSAYGATAIPATFLIGPDGKILAKDLRGDAARKTVAKALGALSRDTIQSGKMVNGRRLASGRK